MNYSKQHSPLNISSQIGEYQVSRLNISKGAFATIHLGKHVYTKRAIAIKELRVPNINNLKPYVRRELEIHKNLNHPNIVKLYDIILNRDNHTIFMILEYCAFGDLQSFQNKRPFYEKYIQHYMLQLRDALKYLYDNGIVHRDLKPQNILLTDPTTLKITDFGLSRNQPDRSDQVDQVDQVDQQDLYSTYCGSPMYMSPEMLNRKSYNSKSDLWSVGIILYQLITGTPPYTVSNIKQLITAVSQSINLDDIPDKYGISQGCYDLLQSLLKPSRVDRIDWPEFFIHFWFSNNIIQNDDNLLMEQPLNYDLLNQMQYSGNLFNMAVCKKEMETPQLQLKNSQLSSQDTNPNSCKIKNDSDRYSGIPIHHENINLSDLEQDDICQEEYKPLSKPINIPINKYNANRVNYRSSGNHYENHCGNHYENHYENHCGNENNSSDSSSMTSPIYLGKSKKKDSPGKIASAIRFIKETYDYFNSDTKSL